MDLRKAEVRADHSELILIRHAKEVEAALAKLPPGALHATRRETHPRRQQRRYLRPHQAGSSCWPLVADRGRPQTITERFIIETYVTIR